MAVSSLVRSSFCDNFNQQMEKYAMSLGVADAVLNAAYTTINTSTSAYNGGFSGNYPPKIISADDLFDTASILNDISSVANSSCASVIPGLSTLAGVATIPVQFAAQLLNNLDAMINNAIMGLIGTAESAIMNTLMTGLNAINGLGLNALMSEIDAVMNCVAGMCGGNYTTNVDILSAKMDLLTTTYGLDTTTGAFSLEGMLPKVQLPLGIIPNIQNMQTTIDSLKTSFSVKINALMQQQVPILPTYLI